MRKIQTIYASVLVISAGFVTASFAGALPVAVPAFDADPGAMRALPSLAPMLDKTAPAVVNIAAHGTRAVSPDPFFSDPFLQRFFNIPQGTQQREIRSVGSGVIVDAKQGLVVTNHHVIAGTEEIAVTLSDGRSFDATLVGSDAGTDLAVLKIKADDLTEVRFANSDALRIGDFVVAIGNPFGLGQTVTSGIVSALGRGGLGLSNYESFIPTAAAINSGNSGGALVNLRGELVGINSQIISRGGGGSIGIGFAIPVNMASKIVAQLVEHGEIRRGVLGVFTQDLSQELAQVFAIPASTGGAVVALVQAGSQAQKSGLQPGDVIIEFNGKPVRRSHELTNALGSLGIGDAIELKIIREQKQMTVQTQIGAPLAPPNADPRQLSERLAGAHFADSKLDKHSSEQGVHGVQIITVERASPAARYGLRKGDVVIAVNRETVKDLNQFKQAILNSGPALMLKIMRGHGSVFILIQ